MAYLRNKIKEFSVDGVDAIGYDKMEEVNDVIADFIGVRLCWRKGVLHVHSKCYGSSIFNPVLSINGLFLDMNELLYIITFIENKIEGQEKLCRLLRNSVFHGDRVHVRGQIYALLKSRITTQLIDNQGNR